MDSVGEHLDYGLEDSEPSVFPAVVELNVGEFRDPIDSQEHDELAVGVAQRTHADVDVADLVGLEPLALLFGLLDRRPRDAMALQAAVHGAAAEVWDHVSKATQNVVQRQQRLLPETHHDGFLDRRQHRALRGLRTHRRIGRRGPFAPLAHRLRI